MQFVYGVAALGVLAGGFGYLFDKVGEAVNDTGSGISKVAGVAVLGFGAYVAAKHFKVI